MLGLPQQCASVLYLPFSHETTANQVRQKSGVVKRYALTFSMVSRKNRMKVSTKARESDQQPFFPLKKTKKIT